MGDDRPILHPAVWPGKINVTRHAPGPELAPFVAYHWVVRWDLDAPYTQRVLTTPHVHLAIQRDTSWVWGVHTGTTTHPLRGEGFVWGVRFRAGAFRPFLDGPVSSLTNRTVGLDVIFGVDPAEIEAKVAREVDGSGPAPTVERMLIDALPAADPMVEEVGEIVAKVAADPAITRVATLASVAGVGTRTLQRLFHEYVGAGPKWVIRQYRLLEAAGRIAGGGVAGWADLAAQLGYSDQAHLIRDFTAAVGAPPARYAQTGGRGNGAP
ncbi:AraC family transcriptional regulator [Virgisporangium aliadipatigenens]|uniref:AraC family transcriptional regulator n=1 Tax=Virgisporangium aliadipatigenens TaxID=741659 RepID=A0A8J3YPV4_9ACTN|nr:helix-turn-helix domain-containing protein [Virgisporangium aliadipatigenens]GIJ47706.1 AraC family transcriptional regulator [Virgisporangium aliadipatigenens]